MQIDLTQAASPGDLIKDATTATFRQDVLEPSMEVPVIVDFWAPWCGPCKQLGPAIEQAVTQAGGAVKLVKINIDESPEIAQQMRVQSIPAVFAFANGQPVDGFVGALPASQIKQFIDRVVKAAGGEQGSNPVEEAFAQAEEAVEAGDFNTAGAIYQQLVQHDPSNIRAVAGFANALLKLGRADMAKEYVDQLPDEQKSDPALSSVIAALELAAEADEARAKLQSLEARVAETPEDLQARFDLAVAKAATGDAEGAIDDLLTIMEMNRAWNDEAARLQLLKIFEAQGPGDPVTIAGRRRLSSLLFS